MMLTSLCRIIIFVADVPRMAAFYRDTFGLTPIPSDEPADQWLELDAGGCRLAFHQAYGAEGPITAPTGSPWNPHKIVFYAEEVAAMREQLHQRGVEMDELKVFGDLQLCDGSDPEGHRFQISNRR